MINIVVVLLAHFYADFHLQGSYIAGKKCDTKEMMFLHCIMYSLVVSLALWWAYGIGFWSIIILFASHWVIDGFWGCDNKLTLWQDQALHLIIIIIVGLR